MRVGALGRVVGAGVGAVGPVPAVAPVAAVAVHAGPVRSSRVLSGQGEAGALAARENVHPHALTRGQRIVLAHEHLPVIGRLQVHQLRARGGRATVRAVVCDKECTVAASARVWRVPACAGDLASTGAAITSLSEPAPAPGRRKARLMSAWGGSPATPLHKFSTCDRGPSRGTSTSFEKEPGSAPLKLSMRKPHCVGGRE